MNTGKTCGSIGERWRISLASLQGPSPLPMENFADPAAEQGNPLEEATNKVGHPRGLTAGPRKVLKTLGLGG